MGNNSKFLVLAFLFCVVSTTTRAKERRIEDFFGTWVPVGERGECDNAKNRRNGSYLIFGKGVVDDGGPRTKCNEIKMLLKNGTLRVSASCNDFESGYFAFLREYTIDQDRLLVTEEKRHYQKCTDLRNLKRELSEDQIDKFDAKMCNGVRGIYQGVGEDTPLVVDVDYMMGIPVAGRWSTLLKDGGGREWVRVDWGNRTGYVPKDSLCIIKN